MLPRHSGFHILCVFALTTTGLLVEAASWCYRLLEALQPTSTIYVHFYELFSFKSLTVPSRRKCLFLGKTTTTKSLHKLVLWRDFCFITGLEEVPCCRSTATVLIKIPRGRPLAWEEGKGHRMCVSPPADHLSRSGRFWRYIQIWDFLEDDLDISKWICCPTSLHSFFDESLLIIVKLHASFHLDEV